MAHVSLLLLTAPTLSSSLVWLSNPASTMPAQRETDTHCTQHPEYSAVLLKTTEVLTGGRYNASLRRNLKMFAQLPMTSRTDCTRPLMKNGPVGEHNLKVFLRRKMCKFEQTVHVRKTCTHAYNLRTHTTLLQILMSPFYTDRNLPNRSLVGKPRPNK